MAARTAVVAGTATAVSGNVQRRQAGRAASKEDEAAQQQQMLVDQAAAQAAAQMQAQQQMQAAAPAAAPPAEDPMVKLRQLGELHSQGLLTDDEFSAAKAKLLGI
jgi:membrane protease subunit (stomatin/prohibitin family)